MSRYPVVTVLEPTWDGNVHLPANIGVLRIVRAAYPDAEIHFVGGQIQVELIRKMIATDTDTRITYHVWPVGQDNDTLVGNVFHSAQKLRRLPAAITCNAERLFLTSCTATMLSALSYLGLSRKTSAVLHGNANELYGWRSRNPMRKAFDLTASLKRFCTNGGKAIVIENRIKNQLSHDFPWFADRIVCLPHPLITEEACHDDKPRLLCEPIQIGFVGLASIDKGFPSFLELAAAVNKARPGAYQFHAIGRLPGESAEFDQSPLITKAQADYLSRPEFLSGVRKLHYIFLWHSDSYYNTAASGVIYDAINLGIPMIARRTAQIQEWHKQGIDVAQSFDDLDAAIVTLSSPRPLDEAKKYEFRISDLSRLRDSLSIPKLTELFVNHFPLLPTSESREIR